MDERWVEVNDYQSKENELVSIQWETYSIPNINHYDPKDFVGYTIIDTSANKVVGVVIWVDKDNIILYAEKNCMLSKEGKKVKINNMIYYLEDI